MCVNADVWMYLTVIPEAGENCNYPDLSPVSAGFLWWFGFYSPARRGKCNPDHPWSAQKCEHVGDRELWLQGAVAGRNPHLCPGWWWRGNTPSGRWRAKLFPHQKKFPKHPNFQFLALKSSPKPPQSAQPMPRDPPPLLFLILFNSPPPGVSICKVHSLAAGGAGGCANSAASRSFQL